MIYKIAVERWSASLYENDIAIINKALCICEDRYDHPPSLSQFKKACAEAKGEINKNKIDIEQYISNLAKTKGYDEKSAREHYRKLGHDC